MWKDLRRAFGIDQLCKVDSTRSNGRKLAQFVWKQVREMTPREREIFEETAYTLPVDFHSWRRRYSQALAEADVNAQQATALAGHASLDVHQRYLASATKVARIPERALPGILARVSGKSRGAESRIQVGVAGFEPATSGTQSRPSTRLRYTPRGGGL